MKRLLLLLLLPSAIQAYEAHLKNDSDISNVYFGLHTTQVGCCCSAGSSCGDGGGGQCDEHNVKPGEVRIHKNDGICAGACWSGVEVWIEGGSRKIGYVDYGGGGQCASISVIVSGSNGNYRIQHVP